MCIRRKKNRHATIVEKMKQSRGIRSVKLSKK